MSVPRIRTVLIEDSVFMRQIISDIIDTDHTIELVGTAPNGKLGSEMAMNLKPDVVITDMVMPEYDGLYVVKSVMEQSPRPIILLSSLEKTNSKIFDALQYGAFEFIDKPAGLDDASMRAYGLLTLIKEASATDIEILKDRNSKNGNSESHTFSDNTKYEIIVIGSSTGGPSAVELIIKNLPNNLTIPVIIAQHMPARFLETFATRLNALSPLPVKIAMRGEVLKGGVIYILSGETNSRIGKNAEGIPTVIYTGKRFAEFNDPSIDCLFESVANTYGSKTIGVILTGMGRDGVNGLLNIKKKGGYTLVQDEGSCIVFGMPKAALQAGAVRQVVKLREIPGFIISCL